MSDDRFLEQCNALPPEPVPVLDPPPPFCGDADAASLRDIDSSPDLSWLRQAGGENKELGASANCDPMLAGKIINETGRTDIVYQYSMALRGCDEAVTDLFRDIVVIGVNSDVHRVPIIWATQEKAVAAVLQPNVRQDNSLVVDPIRLPILAIHSKDLTFAKERYVYHKAVDYMGRLRADGKPGLTVKDKYERDTIFGVARGLPVDIGYTLYAWTLFKEDMNQIVEQVMQKITPMGYIRVRGVHWEVVVTNDSVANNETTEPGDKNVRVIKWQFNMTAKTYIPQPLIRKKAVLKTRVEMVDGIKEDDITMVIARLEDAVKELKC